MVMPYHLHMPSYFLETFTEYPYMDGMFLSECISKSFLEIRVSQREKCEQICHQFR